MSYQFLRPLLFAMPPEFAHSIAIDTLRIIGKGRFAWPAASDDPREAVTLFGLRFPNRVGIAAGFDKNGVCIDGLAAIGFGFVEVGTVTPRPQVLGFVAPDHLLAIANERAVYRLSSTTPGPAEPVAETAEALPQTTLLLPVGLHNMLSVMNDMMERRGYVYRPRSNTAIVSAVSNEHRGYYYAPGTRTAIMAGGTWRPNLQSSQLAPFVSGTSHYLTSEDGGRTYRVTLEADGKLGSTVFAERGGTAVVTDASGNFYIAGSEVWIYDRNGKPKGMLEIPERPGSLAFGGPDRRTLYIAARTSLYSIRTKTAGR